MGTLYLIRVPVYAALFTGASFCCAGVPPAVFCQACSGSTRKRKNCCTVRFFITLQACAIRMGSN
jgi:FPC/CPF motif-containing protein YcgG